MALTRPAALDSAWAYRVKINGIDLHDFGVVAMSAPNLGGPIVENALANVPERHEPFRLTGTIRPKAFVLAGRVLADSAAQLQTNMDALKTNVASLRGSHFSYLEPLRVEFSNQTDRYYPCLYVGAMQVAGAGVDPWNRKVASFTLPLLQIGPAVAVDVTTATPSGTGISWTTLDQGTAPGPLVIELEGAATSPKFHLCDMMFNCDFDYDVVADIADGTTVTGSIGATTDSDQFEPGDEGGGMFEQESGSNTTWSSVPVPGSEGTWICIVRPQFAYNVGADKHIITHYIDASNQFAILYNSTSDKWQVRLVDSGGTTTANDNPGSATAESFATDTRVALAGSYGPAGVKVYVDGVLIDTDTGDTNGHSGGSGTLYLGNQAGTLRAESKFIKLMAFPFQLSDENAKRYSLNPDLVEMHTQSFAKTGNLSANERSIIDTETGMIHKLATDLTKTNDLSDWNTPDMVQLRPSQCALMVPTGESIGGIKVAWRKRWL